MDEYSKNRLAQEDFHLLRENPNPGSRIAIAKKIAQHINSANPQTVEYALACDIAHHLQRDEHAEVRVTLAESLCDSLQAPRELIMKLAEDRAVQVAEPILRESPLLEDDDLNHLIDKDHEPKKLVAIASRRFVSVTISTRLAEYEIELVALTLLENRGAQITEKICKHLMKIFHNHSAIQRSIAERLPVAIKEVDAISRKQSAGQDNNRAVKIPTFAPIETKSVKNDLLTLMLMGQNPEQPQIDKLYQDFLQREKMNGVLLLMSLMTGNHGLFYTALGRATGLPPQDVRTRCLAGEEEFRVIYARSGLSSGLQELIYWLLTGAEKLRARGEKPNDDGFFKGMSRHLREAERRSMNFSETIGRQLVEAMEKTLF
jgi:uncharacterized protein (DUF2336 family)